MSFNWIIFIQSDSLVLVTVKKVSHRAWTWVAGIRKTKFPNFCEIFELAFKWTFFMEKYLENVDNFVTLFKRPQDWLNSEKGLFIVESALSLSS